MVDKCGFNRIDDVEQYLIGKSILWFRLINIKYNVIYFFSLQLFIFNLNIIKFSFSSELDAPF